jgi:hypothetical protein
MGYHYFNKALIDDLVVDPETPEGLVPLGLVTENGPLVVDGFAAVRILGLEIPPARP